MAKTKHQNGKTRKQPHVKKQGKVTDTAQFRAQLDALGLKIIQVTADGNCFFRAIADQLEGNEEEHQKYRHMVVEYIQKNRETFEPFIEDDIPFDEYCQSMGEEGTWAGNMELQAASLVTHSNICIHRSMSPRWYIRNFDEHGACMVHLSYHDEEHYNSVRIKEDPCNGPAKPIIIKADADISAIAHQPKAASTRSKGGTGEDIIHDGSIKMVMAGTGCQNAEKVKQVLEQVHGDVDLAIEFLIAELGTEEYLEETNSLHGQSDASMVMTDGNSDERDKEPVEQTCLKDASSNGVKKSFHDDCPQPDDNKISRNKACPCGSKKKYKVCCGAVSGRSSTKFVINQPVDSRKKKERKQGKKGGPAKTVSTCGSDGGPPDLELRHHSDSKCGHGSPFEHLPDVAGREKHSQVPLEFDNYLAGKLACQYNDLLLTLNARLQGYIVYPSMRVGLQNSCLLLKQDYGITENSRKHLLFILFFWEICLLLPNLLF